MQARRIVLIPAVGVQTPDIGIYQLAISSPNPDASSADSEYHDEHSLPSLEGDEQGMHGL